MTNALDLVSIAPGNESLIFLEKRISLDDYRGQHISQHNRYTIDDVFIILKTLFEIAGNEYMQIRDTDLSKRPFNIAGEEKYSEFVDNVNSKMGRCTQDSLRKNLFVDFHRMGLINRYDTRKIPTDPYKSQHVKYIKLSKIGLDLANETNIFNRRMIYSRALGNLLSNSLDDYINIILEVNKLTIYEYTYFLSFLNQELENKKYTVSDILNLIDSFRRLSRFQKINVTDRIKSYMDPDKFIIGNKKDKRDFHNWINESQQVFMLLDQTVYFESDKNHTMLVPRVGNEAIFDDQVKLDRSIQEKKNYYIYHNVNKEQGFELHHIIPLCWAQSRDEWLVLDNHKNMIYIDGYKHSLITQNNNKNVILDFANDDATFTDYETNDSIYCKYMKNIIYDPMNQSEMKEYNDSILNSFE